MNICIYGAASDSIPKEYIASAESQGRLMAQRGHGLIFGGGKGCKAGLYAYGVHGLVLYI